MSEHCSMMPIGVGCTNCQSLFRELAHAKELLRIQRSRADRHAARADAAEEELARIKSGVMVSSFPE